MDNGWSATHCAAEIGHLEIMKLLNEHSALMSVADDGGATPRDLARVYGHKDCVQFLNE
jgi:FOG: Ankyrin repeat